MKILFVTDYPDKNSPFKKAFVYQIVQKLYELDCEPLVISPTIFWKDRKSYLTKPGKKKYGYENVTILRPKYLVLPNKVNIFGYSLGFFNPTFYYMAVRSALKKMSFQPDIVYGHFLYPNGSVVADLAEELSIPSVVALGESTLDKHVSIYGKKNMSKVLNKVNSILSVSKENKQYCEKELNIPDTKIEVIPNAVDSELFYPRDKIEMRKKFGLPTDKFIVSFVGKFTRRKGPNRVLDALNTLGEEFGGVFIGHSGNAPTGKKVLFCDSVPHRIVPELLSASDIFVLPTLNEGSCNAILEAMACGLPVVSSDIQAIREQISSSSAFLVNPLSSNEIASKIKVLKENKLLLRKMGNSALETANNRSLLKRAKKIFDWLSNVRS